MQPLERRTAALLGVVIRVKKQREKRRPLGTGEAEQEGEKKRVTVITTRKRRASGQQQKRTQEDEERSGSWEVSPWSGARTHV